MSTATLLKRIKNLYQVRIIALHPSHHPQKMQWLLTLFKPVQMDLLNHQHISNANNINTDQLLFGYVLQEKSNGNSKPSKCLLSKDETKRSSVLSTVWKNRNSSVVLSSKARIKIQILVKAHSTKCIRGCTVG